MELLDLHKIVKGLAPAADRWNTNPVSDAVKLDEYAKCVFIVQQQGGTTGKATFTVEACQLPDGTGAVAVPFSYRVGADGAGENGDAMGALQQAAAAGFDSTPNSDRLYAIEIRDRQLPEGKPYVRLKCTESVNDPVNGYVLIHLYRGKFQGALQPSVID